MKKRRLFIMGMCAAFLIATMSIAACNGPSNLKPGTLPEEKKSEAQQALAADTFKNPPAGTTGYKITWTDAQGKQQEKTVTADEVKNGIALPGGVKAGTKPKVTPLIKQADGSVKEGTTQEVAPSASTDWRLHIQAGIDELSKDKPDFDAALAKFKEAYDAEQNNTTKAYYAVVQLATISVKPAAVSFMRDRMGFASYPEKLNALINLEWFKEFNHGSSTGSFPEMKKAAEWYKEFHPILQIPAYIIEHSNSTNVDQLLDELYGIVFGDEFTKASALLNSLDASKPITIDQKLLKVLYLDENVFTAGADAQLHKDQLLGIIGGLTATKGGFELLQSYSFNTDLNVLKWNWDKHDETLKILGSYNKAQDPFNNGFLTGRNAQKIDAAKADMVKGADLLLAAYKSLTDSETLPAKAKAELTKNTAFVQAMVQEIRDAIESGRKANLLIGENNPLKEGLGRRRFEPGQINPKIISMTTFEIDMGKVFSYEYFKLKNFFAMNGDKPQIYPPDGTHSSPYMKLTLKSFMNDFVTMKWADGKEVFDEDIDIPLSGAAGTKIINFYK